MFVEWMGVGYGDHCTPVRVELFFLGSGCAAVEEI
jgi:hypothetical protein